MNGYMTLMFVFINAIASGEVCEQGWTLNQPAQACYKIFLDGNLNWFDAMKNCLRIHSRLSNIESSSEQDFLTEMIKKKSAKIPALGINLKKQQLFIAGIEEVSEGDWGWYLYDGNWFSDVKWQQDQPDDYYNREDCAAMISSRTPTSSIGELNDIPCDWTLTTGYICKRTVQVEIICSKDWLYDVRTATCYLERNTSMTWQEASDVCHGYGGSMASIGSSQDQQFLNAITMSSSPSYYWVGANYTVVAHKNIEWTDQTPWWPGTGFSFGAGSSLGNENLCGVLNEKKLKFEKCGNSHPFICKLKVQSTTVADISSRIAQTSTSMAATSSDEVSTIVAASSASLSTSTETSKCSQDHAEQFPVAGVATGVIAGIEAIVIVALTIFLIRRRHVNRQDEEGEQHNTNGEQRIELQETPVSGSLHNNTWTASNEQHAGETRTDYETTDPALNNDGLYDAVGSGEDSNEQHAGEPRNVYETIDPALKNDGLYDAVGSGEDEWNQDNGDGYVNLKDTHI